MQKLTKEQEKEVFRIYDTYTGNNPFILMLKKKREPLSDFEMEYIYKNHNYQPVHVQQMVNITEWMAKKKQEKWGTDFLPTKLFIEYIIGETEDTYNCYVWYRKSQDKPVLTFLYKKEIITPIMVSDFTKMDIDFRPYDVMLDKVKPGAFVMDHQKRSVQFLLDRKKCILAHEPGLGKSMCAIIASIVEKKHKVLVICPKSLKTNWKREISTFVDPDDISIVDNPIGMNKTELTEYLNLKDSSFTFAQLQQFAKERGKWREGRQFTILNYDIIDEFHKAPEGRKDAALCYANSQLVKSKFDVVIIDEAHKLADTKSTRSKTIRSYLKMACPEYVWLLTGTPVVNKPKDLFNMLVLLDHDLTKDYQWFMQRYCGAEKQLRKGEWERCWNNWSKGRFSNYNNLTMESKKAFREYVDKYGKHVYLSDGATNLEELAERIRPIYFRAVKTDIKGIGDKHIHFLHYDMTDLERYEYQKQWREYMTEKLAEIADEQQREEKRKELWEQKKLLEVGILRRCTSEMMMRRTTQLVDKLVAEGKKVFIACCYDDEVFGLRDYYGDKCVIYKGGMSTKEKDSNVEAFNNDDNVTIFIGNVRAAGVGINLNKSCSIAVFQNMEYTPADFDQMCDRIHRIGSTNDVDIYVQVIDGSIYEHIVEIIERKNEIVKKLISKQD